MSDNNRSFHFSSIIKTVVEKADQGEASSKDDLGCAACEMLVSWVANQLKQEGTKESVLNYVNQVINLRLYAPLGSFLCLLFTVTVKLLL